MKMRSEAEQQAIREDIFRWLDEKLGSGAYELSRDDLENYRFHGERIPLLDRNRGIRNPADFSSTLTLMTSAKHVEYNDQIRPDGLLRYSYRSGDSADNVKLRRAAERKSRLVYLKGVRPGVYLPYYPAYIVGDDPTERAVYLAFDEMFDFFGDPLHMTGDERRYAERVTRVRLHQPMFRARVLRAYRTTCAVCTLKHAQFIDAAHIIGDGEVDGFAHVTNGLALCKLQSRGIRSRLDGHFARLHSENPPHASQRGRRTDAETQPSGPERCAPGTASLANRVAVTGRASSTFRSVRNVTIPRTLDEERDATTTGRRRLSIEPACNEALRLPDRTRLR